MYCTSKDAMGVNYGPLLDAQNLNDQSVLFVLTMKNQSKAVMESEAGGKLTTLWKKATQNPQLAAEIFEFVKLANIGIVLILGSVEDERTFSRLEYVKNLKRNRLDTHLDVCLRLFEQNLYTLENFPYQLGIGSWCNASTRGRYGLNNMNDDQA